MSHEQEDQEPTAAATSNNASDWLDESIAFLTADIDLDLDGYGWLPTSQQHRVGVGVADSVPPPVVVPQGPAPVSTSVTSSPVTTSPQEFGQPKRRKSPEHKAPGHSSQRPQVGGGRDGAEQDNGGASYSRKPSKKSGAKGGAASVGRDARWAEQLLNPCAVAIETGSLARVQHLFYVLGELASFSSGEANHRLAAYGLRSLVVRLPDAVGQAAAASIKIPPCECLTPAFSGIEPRLFRASLIKFHEVSPWFALPNALANAAIAYAATRGAATAPRRQLHVVDLGVSHGVQWPTLLDALSRVPRGSTPPSVRLTVAGPTATPPVPFSASPPGYDFSPQLLRYAKSINLDLAIDRATSLDALHGFTTPGDALVVCLQFRLWHVTAEEQAIILQKVRNLNPELVALAELDGGGHGDGSVPSEFAARLELLWRFLESTAAAFKGRDADERLVMEAEAGTALAAAQWGAVVDGREGWRERRAAAGFEEAAFGGEAVETAKALLRKYDGGWEMVAPSPAAGGGAVGLRWKGQPVSFCSLWRPA